MATDLLLSYSVRYINNIRRGTMRKLFIFTSLLLLLASPLFGFSVFHQIGDNDGFGFGIADNADVPDGMLFYDNRSAAELAATDGSQWTDTDQLYLITDPVFSLFFDVNLFNTVTWATLTIDVQGMQPSNGSLPSYLYFDGVQVPGFETIDLGPYGSQVLTYNVNLAMLADGQLDVFLDVNDFSNDPTSIADFVAVDFTRLEVCGTPVIPEPATLLFLGLGLAGIGIYRRRK